MTLRNEQHTPLIPSRHLPPVAYRELPEPKRLKEILGASIILAAVAIGSGETVLWPYISSQVGLVLMWAALVGFLTQTFLNMEIERYTLATGETAITGFTRMWKPWGFLFTLIAIVTHIFPGWATGSATVVTYALGFGDATYIAVASLIAIGVALTLSPVVYQAVEKMETVLVTCIAVFLILALLLATSAEGWGAFVTGFGHVGRFPPLAAVGGAAALFGAIVYAGGGGQSNLAQSNWIRDKGLGMGAYIPRIVSPITGHEEAAPGTGYTFRPTEENLRRWRGWWRVANIEQFLTFFVLGSVTLVIMSVLAYVTVFGRDLPSEEFDFVAVEGRVLGQQIGAWFTYAFWGAITAALFSTQIAVMDYVARIAADNMKVTVFRERTGITESRIYYAVVWLLIVCACTILLVGLEEPLVLLLISAVSGGFSMFIYSILLTVMNRRYLPEGVRLSGYRVLIMIWAILFYGVFSVVVLVDEVGALL